MLEEEILIPDNVWNLVLFFFREQFAFNIFVAGLIVSFILSFAVGANDSANSWGTSVGAKTVSLGWAYFIGSIMELVGCTLLSGDVIKKIVSGIVNIDIYRSDKEWVLSNFTQAEPDIYLQQEKILAIGCLSVMLASGVWQLIASICSWPVSGTHCIIFGLLGFTLTAKGSDGLKDVETLMEIIGGLFFSIIASVMFTALLYGLLYKYCIRRGKPFDVGNRIVYGLITGLAVGIPVTFILLQTNKAYAIFSGDLKQHSFYISLGIGLAVGLIVSILAIFLLLPIIKNTKRTLSLDFDVSVYWKAKKMSKDEQNIELKEVDNEVEVTEEALDQQEVTKIFRPLQVLSAVTSSLVHGGNDVANCIGPFVVIYHVYQEGMIGSGAVKAPWSIALLGGVGIAAGFIMFGHRVIRTMGSNISEMNSSRGFCVEWVASVIVLVGTTIGLPLSTTHCKVGGVIGAGLVQGLVETNSPKMALKYVNFKVLIGVLLSWVLTVPASMGLSSVIFLILKKVML